jgi:hypothetical protein
MNATKRWYGGLAAAALAAAAMGCSDSTGGGDAQLTVQLADAPSDLYASAVVEIGRIELVPAEGAPIVVTENGGTHDLLDLQNGVAADLASLPIESGRYLQLRLVVNSASVTLAEGLTFNDGSQTKDLFIPSGAQTGIKINLNDEGEAGIDIVPGETILLVDFDVSQNFIIQGEPGTPAGITGVLFTPLLRAVVRNVAGSIAGAVTSSGSPLADATVRARLVDPGTIDALQTAEATAVTDASGAYKIWFLAPGTYAVSVDGMTGEQTVVVGESEDVTGVNFNF